MACSELNFSPIPTALTLPDDPSDLNCLLFAKRALWCYGPTGVWSGIYREGHGTECAPFIARLTTCLRVKWTPSYEKKVEILKEISQELENFKPKPDHPPLWNLRSSPPSDFHDYQKTTIEEENQHWKELFGVEPTVINHPHGSS